MPLPSLLGVLGHQETAGGSGSYLLVTDRSGRTLLDHTVKGSLTLLDRQDFAFLGRAVAFSPDNAYAVVAGLNDFTMLLERPTPGSLVISNYTSTAVAGAAFSPDSEYIAAVFGSDVTVLQLFITQAGPPTPLPVADFYFLDNGGNGVAFSPDGDYIATPAGSTLTLLNAPSLTLSDTYELASGLASGRDVAFSSEGAYLAAVNIDSALGGDPYVTLLQYVFGQLVFSDSYLLPGSGEGVAFSPDGQYIAAIHDGSPYLTLLQKTFGQLSLADTYLLAGQPLGQATHPVAFSPDGAYLVAMHTRFALPDAARPHDTGAAEPGHDVHAARRRCRGRLFARLGEPCRR